MNWETMWPWILAHVALVPVIVEGAKRTIKQYIGKEVHGIPALILTILVGAGFGVWYGIQTSSIWAGVICAAVMDGVVIFGYKTVVNLMERHNHGSGS